MGRRRIRTAGGIGLIVVLAVLAALAGYGETRAARTPVAAHPRPSTIPSALARATVRPSSANTDPAAVALPARVAAVLRPALAAPGLGRRLRARILDVDSGTVLLDRGGAIPTAPASTAKLLTAAALLTVRRPTDRITTTVDAVAGGTLVLVGGGDPTLTGARGATASTYPGAARISDLAAQVRRAHVPVNRIVVDDSVFAGPTVSPGWDADDVPTGYASAITGVLADGGRAAPGDTVRSASPDLAAGAELAAALGRPNLSVARGGAPAGSRQVARVRSAPLSTLVDQMLMDSDNVIAECLGRQVAITVGQPVTFTGAAAAIRDVVGRLGVRSGTGLVDASGLAAGDRVTAGTLAAILRVIVDGSRPALRAALPGLPVAGWSGTLADRYLAGSSRAGAGVVRAKTGTLTGVSSLAGLVHDRSGRLLAVVLMADRTGSTIAAEQALDTIAAKLAGCGCS